MRQFLSISLLGMASILTVSSQPSTAFVPNNEAVIVNSGSTNTIGYRIYVAPDGQVIYVDGKGRHQGRLPAKLAKRFFQDVKAAMPLSRLSVEPCVRSSSFGTSTTIKLGAEQSPDISCPSNRKAEALENDTAAITNFLGVTNVPIRQGRPLPPQNF